jgi:H+-transporting ATPase
MMERVERGPINPPAIAGAGEERPRRSLELEEEYARRVRASVDIVRDNYPHDARKPMEAPPTADQYKAAVEYRKSLDERRPPRKSLDIRKSLEEQRPVRVVVEPVAPPPPPPPKDEREARKSLEEAHEKPEEHLLKEFPKSEGLSTVQAEKLLQEYGSNELPEKKVSKFYIFFSLMWQPMPVMIWIAAVVEAAIGNYIDTGILVTINIINATLSFYETVKAGDAVAALKASLKPTASVNRDGKWNDKFDARLLVPGDLIELAAGKAVPADCMLNEGTVDVDESAMTGESLPVTLHEREMAKMGGTVARGETHATVVLTGKDTFFGKTASLLSNTERMSNLAKLLLRIIIILCVLSFVLVGSAFAYLLGTGETVKEALSFAVVVIVASIPMAIEIVTTTTLAIGSKVMSKFGAIVSRLAAIEDLAGLNMLCSDKTGTLTKNKMTIQEEAPTYEPNTTQMDLLRQAALATRWESPPKDALDTLFLRCHLWAPGIQQLLQQHVAAHPNITQADKDAWYNDQIAHRLSEALADYESLAFVPFDPRVKRTESTIRVKSTGAIFKVTKGAPHILNQLDHDEQKSLRMMAKVTELGKDGIRAVALAVSEPITSQWVVGGDNQNVIVNWHITGLLTFMDPPRDDTRDTIARAQSYGVPVRMITGDHILIAKKTCRDLRMGNVDGPNWPDIRGPDQLPTVDKDGKAPDDLVQVHGEHIRSADGFAQVFPEHKFLIVETFRRLGYKCGMTGDGVNDAPALKRADVGIAVAGATDAARAAADIILTQEGLGTIVLGIEVSRCIFARMKSFLTYRVAATLQLLTFFFIAVFAFPPAKYVTPFITPNPEQWPTFFSLPVIYLMIITIINDGTLISVGYDHAVPSRYPERWVLPVLFMVSAALGLVACLSSLLLLYYSLSSWEPGNLFQVLGIGGLTYGQVVNVMFLKVAVSDVLTLFSARTSHQFFFQRKPHFVLLGCALAALALSTLLALVWPCGTLDNIPVCGLGYEKGQKIALWVWLYCFVVFIVQDLVKVATWRVILRNNLFNVNNEVQNPAKNGK